MSLLSFIPGVGPIIDAVVGFFTKVITWLIDNPKILFAIIVASIIAYGSYKGYAYVTGLQDTIVTQEKTIKDKDLEITGLKKDVALAKITNENNQRVIDQLGLDKKAYTGIINNLAASKKKTEKNLQDLHDKVAAMGKEDDGPVAKVLSTAVDGIQDSRKARDEIISKSGN